MVRILFVGDICGSEGRRAMGRMLAALHSRFNADLTIANAENAAGGLGITAATASALFDIGVDVITLGNHAFAKRDAEEYVEGESRVLRPANYPEGAPGRGWGVFECPGGSMGVACLLGRVFMAPMDCPFAAADTIVDEMRDHADAIVFDMHAEATSEKVAMGWYLDGRAAAVIGTHTHVQTSDDRVLPNGTAYLTDAGMTGVVDSVLGMDIEVVLTRFTTGLSRKFALARGECALQGAVVDVDEVTGLAISIERINIREGEV